MGRYKKEAITIRRFPDFDIIFYDRETIWIIRNHNLQRIIYHRWFGPLYTYGNWHNFSVALWQSPYLDPIRIAQLAHRFNISWHQTTRAPNLDGKKIRLKHATIPKRREPWTRGKKSAKNGSKPC